MVQKQVGFITQINQRIGNKSERGRQNSQTSGTDRSPEHEEHTQIWIKYRRHCRAHEYKDRKKVLTARHQGK